MEELFWIGIICFIVLPLTLDAVKWIFNRIKQRNNAKSTR